MSTVSEVQQAQVKSRLLPLSSLVFALEWLVERLPRLHIGINLTPPDNVAVINANNGEYRANGSAPFFTMTYAPEALAGGWYYIEAALVRNNGSRVACICADIRHAGKDSITIPIPTNLRGTVREVLYLPPNIRALRWSPTAEPGLFSQSQLLVHKINPLESIVRRMSRVIFDLWRFRNRPSIANAGLSWWGAITDLQDAYQRTATLRINRSLDSDYSAFIAIHNLRKSADLSSMRKRIPKFRLRPVISLIMEVKSPTEQLFRAALDSVSRQIYPDWELVLTGDFPADAKTHEIAQEYRNKNARIIIVNNNPVADLATALNSALELAQGEFVMRIDQHDLITPHALFMLAQEINKFPDCDLVYSDDDSIDNNDKQYDPRFKPDWNPDLFFSYNYLTNLTLFRLARIVDIGGYRPGFDGATDYDLSLRFLRNIPAKRIRHIPMVLYHSRTASQHAVSANSPIHGNSWSKTGAYHSVKCALEAYFEGSGIAVENGLTQGLYRIKHPLPTLLPLVSIIVPTRDQVELLSKCVDSIRSNTDYDNWELLIVDNQSAEPATHRYLDQIRVDSRIRVIQYAKPFNYSALNNFAVQFARGKVLVLMNNDVEAITKGWLKEMVSHALRPEIGAVGAKLLYSNGTVQHAGVILGLGGVAGHAHRYLKSDDHGYCHRAVVAQNLSAVTGACMAVRRKSFLKVGGLNATDLTVAFNDIDFCLKLAAAGYRNLFTPYALLYHHESISRGPDDTPEKQARFLREFEYMKRTWGEVLQNDTAYNPNLTLDFETFALGNNRSIYA